MPKKCGWGIEMNKKLPKLKTKYLGETNIYQYEQVWTGMYDRNGQEVYTGDILDTWYLVDLEQGIDKSSNIIMGYNYSLIKSMEITGNIIDNPELLSEDQK